MGLNTIKSTGNWGGTASDLNNNFATITAELEKLKAANIKFKGFFSTSSTLNSAHPSPSKGDSAWVGSTYPGVVYECKTAGVWTNTNKAPNTPSIQLSDYATKLGLFFYDYEVSSKIPNIEILSIDKDKNFIIDERLFLSYVRNDKTARALQFRDDLGNIIFNYYTVQSAIKSGVEKIILTSSKYKDKNLITTINWSLSGSYVLFGSDNIPFGPELNLSSITYTQEVIPSYTGVRIGLNNAFVNVNPKYEEWLPGCIERIEILKNRNNYRLFLQSFYKSDKKVSFLIRKSNENIPADNIIVYDSPVLPSGKGELTLSNESMGVVLKLYVNYDLFPTYNKIENPFNIEIIPSSVSTYVQEVAHSYTDKKIALNNIFVNVNPKYEEWLPGCIERLEVVQNKNNYRLFLQSFYKNAAKVYFLIRKSNENIPADNIIVYDSPVLPSGKGELTLSNESMGVVLKLYVNYDLFPTYNKIENPPSIELNLTANYLFGESSDFSGDYNDLDNKPAIPTPTPIATSQQLGKVKPDGRTILIDEHGVLVAAPQVQGSTIIIKPETKEGYRNIFPDPNFALGQWILNDNNAIWLQNSGAGQIEIVYDNNEPAIKQTIAKSGAFGLSLKIRLNPDVYKAYAQIGTKFKIGAYFKFSENESGAVKNWGFANYGLKGSVTTSPVASSTSYAIPLNDYSWKEQTFEITQINDGIIAMGFNASCSKIDKTPVSMYIKGITFYFSPNVSETGEMRNFSSEENTQFIGDIKQIGTLLSHYIESNKGLIRNLLFNNAECQGAVLNINSYQNKSIVNKSRFLELSENYAFPSKGTYIGRKEDGVYICIDGVEHKI